jgi:hypothetical protein
MKVKSLSILFAVMLLAVVFSGCNEEQETSMPLSIAYLNVEPRWIYIGETANLSWSVIGANSVNIDNEIGDVSLDGSQIISPDETMTFTLTASNETKNLTKTIKIYVKIKHPTSDIPSQENVELTSQFESFLSNVVIKQGYECNLYIDTTSFKIGEPISSVVINTSYNIQEDIDIAINRTACLLDGYYIKNNITSFIGHKWSTKGLLGTSAPGNLAYWNAQPAGEYYYYYGIYDCEDIENTLNINCNESNIQDILQNVQPLVYDKLLITVSNELADCVNDSYADTCWRHVAEVTHNCSYCENIESDFWKEKCYEDC